MTTPQITLIKQTWLLLREVDPQLLGDVFYKRLFLTYPQVRPLFKGPMDVQYRKFVGMLSFIVARLDRPHEAMEEIADMARRHEVYGVKLVHYQPVGEALLWTLEQGLGNQWNEDVRQAWLACYTALSQAMTKTE